MPDRAYSARHEPPSILDHVLAHPGLVACAVWWVIMGIICCTVALDDATMITTRPLIDFEDAEALGLGRGIGRGGSGTLWATLTTRDELRIRWRVQQWSLLLSGCAWALYTATSVWWGPWSLVAWGHGACMTTVAVLGWLSSRATETATREQARSLGLDA